MYFRSTSILHSSLLQIIIIIIIIIIQLKTEHYYALYNNQ